MSTTSQNRISLLSDNSSLSDGITKDESSWNTMTQVSNYVNSIELGELSLDSPDLYRIITAIPSPWVRSIVTKNALTYRYISNIDKEQNNLSGMGALYSAIQDEYKGVIACLGLYTSQLKVERIDLEYTDAQSDREAKPKELLQKANNIYELSGAFGNMLFEDSRYWLDTDLDPVKDRTNPYVLLVSINNQVFAGTSPSTLIYPAANYDLKDSNIPFYVGGRFRNPSEYLEYKDLTKLYYYVVKLRDQLSDYDEEWDKKNPISFVFPFFKEFQEEIAHKIKELKPDFNFEASGVVDYCDKFAGNYPYTKIFDIDEKVYKTPDGRYLIENETGDLPEFNPSQLLLSIDKTSIVKLDANLDYSNTSVLEALDENGKKHYFTLPLSEVGIYEFQNELKDVLGKGPNTDKHNKLLEANYLSKSKQLEVSLRLEISGNSTYFSKIYQISNPDEPLNPGVQMWPNYISKDWKNYYTFSNIPHTGRGLKAIPLISSEEELKKVRFKDVNKLYYFNQDELQTHTKCLVTHDSEIQSEKKVKYEIFESEYPFLGFEFRLNSDHLEDLAGGYVMLYTDTSSKVLKGNQDHLELESVTVAIDFGSTNTSVSYLDRMGKIHNLKLSPKKIDLFKSRGSEAYQESLGDLFFFHDRDQDTPFRSALIQHNSNRLTDPTLQKSQAVSGGISLQKHQLPVVDGDKSSLSIEVEDEQTDVIYDLKWKRQDRFLVNKKAYLKNVWLITCAELFQNGKKPNKLVWSYPNSMPRDLIRTYEGMFEEIVADVSPIDIYDVGQQRVETAKINGSVYEYDKAITESEAICNYALTFGKVSISKGNIFIGVDIGGITSDIHVVTNDPGESRALLVKQSSVKIAGDRLANVIGKSESVKLCLQSFIRKHGIEIDDVQKIDEETSGYYTNLLFDYLEGDSELEAAFYNTIWAPDDEELNRDETRGLIAIPAYVCGLLLFHSGQLLASSIDLDGAEKTGIYDLKERLPVTLSSFGKGGKLFDWLPVAFGQESANKYYNDCFQAGLKASSRLQSHDKVKSELKHSRGNKDHLKREVSMGLLSQRGIVVNHEKAANDIIGEVGYSYDEGKEHLDWNFTIEPHHIFEIGEKFQYPEPSKADNSITGLERFDAFLNIFLDLVRKEGIIDHSFIKKESEEFIGKYLEVYVKNDEDWRRSAQVRNVTDDEEDFKYSGSPFLFQGASYLDDIIIPNIYKGSKS